MYCLIPKKVLRDKYFRALSMQDKITFFYLLFFANKDGKVEAYLEDIMELSNCKSISLDNLIKRSFITVNDCTNEIFIVNAENLELSSNFVSSLPEIEIKKSSNLDEEKLVAEWEKRGLKFEFWREILYNSIRELKLHNCPIDWALGITHKVYQIVKNRQDKDHSFTLSSAYCIAINNNILISTISNNCPPFYPFWEEYNQKGSKNNIIEKHLKKMKDFFGGGKDV